MPGKPPRRKGDRVERELVKLHLEAEIPCERVPLSGAAGGSHTGDLDICGAKLKAEVKARSGGSGFSTMERWLGTNDVLICKRARTEPFVALNWSTYVMLLRAFRDASDAG